MTKSNAFRSMSHIFHGKKPRTKNTEKRLRGHRFHKPAVATNDTPLGKFFFFSYNIVWLVAFCGGIFGQQQKVLVSFQNKQKM